MANLVAIGYPDQTSASAAADELRRLDGDLAVEPEAIAVIQRDREGDVHVTTSHHAVDAGASWGMFWDFLFGLLFFVPVFGMPVGAGVGAVLQKIEKAGIDAEFRDQVRDMLQPGTSALFFVVEKVSPDRLVHALSTYRGTVLRSPLSEKAQVTLQKELRGVATAGVRRKT